jgi:predicted  nucleic acid-binding Zn-ribbon protein
VRIPGTTLSDTEPAELSKDERRLRDVDDALRAAGVPRAGEADLELSAADRIRWLADQRDDKELAREREAKETNRWAGEARTLSLAATQALAERDEAIAERDQLRRMHDSVSADLDRERREHQEAMGEAAARELKLTEEHDAGLAQTLGDADIITRLTTQRDNVAAERDAAWNQCEELRTSYKKLTDTLSNDVEFFKRETNTRGAEVREAAKKIEDLSGRYNLMADALQARTAERDKAEADQLTAADEAAALATENARLERLVIRLTSKVKRLEAEAKAFEAKQRERLTAALTEGQDQETHMKKLGKIQQSVYESLKRHGSWSLGCGWIWDTPSNTMRIMDSLVRAGYAITATNKRPHPGGDRYPGERTVYRPTTPSAKKARRS